jgi:hypothetical protein
MSAGDAEDDRADAAGLERVKRQAWFAAGMALPFTVEEGCDIPYVGGSAIDGRTIYVDRHFPPRIAVEGRLVDLRPGLIRHEQVEGVLLRSGRFDYGSAHHIANAAEDRVYRALGLDPAAADRAYGRLIRADAGEQLERVPADLNLLPYLAPPADKALLARMRAAMGCK